MQTAFFGPGALGAHQAGFGSYLPAPQLGRLNDECLIGECRRGNPSAFNVLIKRYERPIYHLAYRLAGNHDDARDICSETFLRIYRALGTFQCAITLPAWINRIVSNVFYDRRRRAQRRPAISLDALIEAAGDGVLSEVGGGIDPAEAAEEKERRTILAAAISTLPDYQRTMVTLFHADGRTYEEIADLMNIPVGTVKSRLNRARSALREKLAPQMAALTN